MFTIEWDKDELKRVIEGFRNPHPQYWKCFGIASLFRVFVDDVDISGLGERQDYAYTRLTDLFLGTFSVFRSIDPVRLRNKPFHLSYNVENCVLGEGFRYYVSYDRTTDLVAFYYIYTGKKRFQSVAITLKDFASGVILSAEEIMEEILSILKGYEDTSYQIFKADLDIIKDWYREVYGKDADLDRLPPVPALERQKPGVVTTDHPGAVEMVWNRKELETDIQNQKISPWRYSPGTWRDFEMVFHFFINDVDIIGGASTYFEFLFSNLNWVFHRFDPEHIPQEKMHYASDEPEAEVVGTGFEITVSLLDDHETVLIDYMSAQMSIHRARTTVSLKKFAKVVVQANEEFLRESREVWSEVVQTNHYQWMLEDIATLREWYRERYQEEVPQLKPL